MIIVTGLVLLSVLLLLVTIPFIIQDTSPGSDPRTTAISAFVMIVLHLVISYQFIKTIRANKKGRKTDKGLTIGLGVLLIFLGFIILDGAFAFLDKVLFGSILMLVVVFCDILAAIATFVVIFLNPKNKNQTDL